MLLKVATRECIIATHECQCSIENLQKKPDSGYFNNYNYNIYAHYRATMVEPTTFITKVTAITVCALYIIYISPAKMATRQTTAIIIRVATLLAAEEEEGSFSGLSVHTLG